MRGRGPRPCSPCALRVGPHAPPQPLCPHALPNRNGSLSYDSLLNPGSRAATPARPTPQPRPGHAALPARRHQATATAATPQLQPSATRGRRSPRSGATTTSPRTIMASIQEQGTESGALLRLRPTLSSATGVYDTPKSWASLQQAGVLSEGSTWPWPLRLRLPG